MSFANRDCLFFLFPAGMTQISLSPLTTLARPPGGAGSVVGTVSLGLFPIRGEMFSLSHEVGG